MSRWQIALNRFGLGGHPGQSRPVDARAWLIDQISVGKAAQSWPQIRSGQAGFADYARERLELAKERRSGAATSGQEEPQLVAIRKLAHTSFRKDSHSRLEGALRSQTPFHDRLVYFWSNHFAISADKHHEVRTLAGAFEQEAIRPHVGGKFVDMLLAVSRHPAMLTFLDQSQSVGAESPFAKTGKWDKGLNENLGREILELHTMGARSGYTQADVIELAKALTGWTIAGDPNARYVLKLAPDAQTGTFTYIDQLHEPGARTLLGKKYPPGGEAQAVAILKDLAMRPETAKHLATKLAIHFVGDSPSPALVGQLAEAYLKSGGDLAATYTALIDASEPWADTATKFRNPWDWTVAALRAAGFADLPAGLSTGVLGKMGQPVWQPGSPAGFDDLSSSWMNPEGLLLRAGLAERIAMAAPQIGDVPKLAGQLFPDALSPQTLQAITRAESSQQALSILLCSPEMLRR